MKYSDFFKNFYIDRSKSGIIGKKSKETIPEFFFVNALGSGSNFLPQNTNTYRTWYDEIRNPDTKIWQAVVSNFNEEEFKNALEKNINISELNTVAARFGIKPNDDENVDKESFAFAVSKLFYKIAEGNGEADNIAPQLYNPSLRVFPTYAKKAEDKFSKIKMPFIDTYEERLLDDIYVCNRLSNRKLSNKNLRATPLIIENVTLSKLSDMKLKKVKLIANGGVGKSMMMQHLFYQAIKEHMATGKLPILAELRQFNSEKTIIEYLVESVTRFREDFDEDTLIKLLEQGKCQIMLDGIDEIDPSDKSRYKNELSTLIDSYGDNQFVIASRDCEMAELVNGFMPLYIQDFNKNEREKLIDNILNKPEDYEINEKIKNFIDGDFIKEHPTFASNPMLLTFVIAKFPLIDTYDNKKSLFYREIYRAVVFGHDEAKADYDRVFHSVQNGHEFTMVFKEFCAKTFIDGIHVLDENDFNKYFGLITSKNTLKNPYGFKVDGFKRDACATSCMMYQEQSKTFYIDKGFQELMFADYMQSIDEEIAFELSKDFWNKPYEYYNGGDAFEMLYEMEKKKVEYIMFLPYLKKIFEIKDEDTSFLKFMELSYGEFDYEVNDFELMQHYTSITGREWVTKRLNIVDSTNTIYSLLMHALEMDSHFGISIFGKDMSHPEIQTNAIIGDLFVYEGKDVLTTMPISNNVEAFEQDHILTDYLTSNGHLVVIGAMYRIKFEELNQNKEKYNNLLMMLKEKNGAAWTRFIKLKEYYNILKEKYKDF